MNEENNEKAPETYVGQATKEVMEVFKKNNIITAYEINEVLTAVRKGYVDDFKIRLELGQKEISRLKDDLSILDSHTITITETPPNLVLKNQGWTQNNTL